MSKIDHTYNEAIDTKLKIFEQKCDQYVNNDKILNKYVQKSNQNLINGFCIGGILGLIGVNIYNYYNKPNSN